MNSTNSWLSGNSLDMIKNLFNMVAVLGWFNDVGNTLGYHNNEKYEETAARLVTLQKVPLGHRIDLTRKKAIHDATQPKNLA